uniref:Uncharacterized protein n=1 Tax=Arundo donax TaxID=35708 RepID=A0A0A9CD67_ARUDO
MFFLFSSFFQTVWPVLLP